jgi:hypothetical protein
MVACIEPRARRCASSFSIALVIVRAHCGGKTI